MNSLKELMELIPSSLDAEESRKHSELLDLQLGLDISSIEERLLARAQAHGAGGDHRTWGQSIHQGNQTWVGLSHQTLQTPYSELKQMCSQLTLVSGDVFVDLGAGYGRMGLLLSGLYSDVSFLGYEYVPERVSEGNRLYEKYNCETSQLIEQDLTSEDFKLPLANYYLIYDYGTVPHIRRTLKQLEVLADKKRFTVIGRGKGTRSLIEYEFPWLSNIQAPLQEKNYSIYTF